MENAKESGTNRSDSSQQQCRNNYTSPVRDMVTFKRSGKPRDSYTPLNTKRDKKNLCSSSYPWYLTSSNSKLGGNGNQAQQIVWIPQNEASSYWQLQLTKERNIEPYPRNSYEKIYVQVKSQQSRVDLSL